ncbi:MAG: hypothetical protein HY685_06570 [Chloroflexi bacterium]|nr:hypothetical protein [Chloroflexota bacterium]
MSQRLKTALARLFRAGGRAGTEGRTVVDVRPRSAFDALLDLRLTSLEKRVDEMRGRIYGLIFLVLGAVAVQTVLRLMGL